MQGDRDSIIIIRVNRWHPDWKGLASIGERQLRMCQIKAQNESVNTHGE